ncbi:hypothetical protein J7E38_09895 [Bacillus sp. ISL-35]|uniref:hypothetical protein n=1 Tax=Bacillus sp. ISL-35 TaxID=2819122 RepID=UPI001BE71F2E|nr:hypothetical protein [Bacillus sp. ISL-35]MBT2679315.1 hypothetical protein [Bacillus sp. ISL-35]MBT2703213.1 hypothetical protein [Chryseobacterium sp. ISL-80]
MFFVKFTLYTVAAVIPWTMFFLYLGIVLGENWAGIKDAGKPYIIPVAVIALIAGIVFFLLKKKQALRFMRGCQK